MPLSVMGSMPSSYRPNEIFHQSPALKRTGWYSYSSVDDDEEIEKHQIYVDNLQMEREKWQARERNVEEAKCKKEAENKKNKSLGLQPFWDIIDKIRRNSKRLLEEKELEQMCREYGLNWKSLSEEDKVKFWNKCAQ
jgi:hypothetical protein